MQNSIPSKIRAFKLDDLFALNWHILLMINNLTQRDHRAKIIKFCGDKRFLQEPLTRISHQLCWRVEQPVFSRFQVTLAGNVHKHFQESHLEYSGTQMFQAFPEAGEKCGLTA
ncbi:MAG: hypothetical protein AAF443_08350 [Chlamydiota bacterium]